jgi:hypothetical protein
MTKPPRMPARSAPLSKSDPRDPKFARDITRAEFGRFYWNDELAEEVRRACLGRSNKRQRE